MELFRDNYMKHYAKQLFKDDHMKHNAKSSIYQFFKKTIVSRILHYLKIDLHSFTLTRIWLKSFTFTQQIFLKTYIHKQNWF